MTILKNATAGTMESSDIMVLVSPFSEGIQIELESSVYSQFGEQILDMIRSVAEEENVDKVYIKAHDFGALDCTIRARVKTALERASKEV